MKKLLAIIAAMLAIINVAYAYDFESGGIYYNITSEDNKTVEVTYQEYGQETPSYTGDIIIPEKTTYSDTEYSVTSIGDEAFADCSSLTSIELPSSVTSIGDYAFVYSTSLTNIELPSSITSIGDYAFGVCSSLTTVISLNPEPPILGVSVFIYSPIEAVYVPAEAISAYQAADGWKDLNIGDVAYKDLATEFEVDGIYYHVTSFANKTVEVTYQVYGQETPSYTGDIIIPETVISSDTEYTVTTIGKCAFYGCTSLTSVKLPVSLTSIGDYAFWYCSSLTSIEIPASVTKIEITPFAWCTSLQQITVASDNLNFASVDGVLYLKDLSLLMSCPGGKSGEFSIPSSVDRIYLYAFYGCTSLTSIELPSSVSEIDYSAFAWCTSLTKVISLNPEPPTLDSYVFYQCPIETVYVPTDAVSLYQADSKWGEFNIQGMVIEKEVTNFEVDGIRYHVLSSTDKTVEVSRGDYSGDISIPEKVTYSDIEYTVTAIGEYAFRDCKSLTSIEIPESVNTIGKCAFYYCTSLTGLKIPESVTEIAIGTFNGCTSLTSIELPSAVTSIGDLAFENCTSLTSIDLPSSLTSIGIYVFRETSLTSIEIPKSVNTIGKWAFCKTPLTSVELPESLNTIEYGTFSECTSLTIVEIPSSVTKICEAAFQLCESLDNVKIPSSVTSIGDYAFYGCTSLTSFEIPASVTEIGMNPFAYCTSLQKLTVASENLNFVVFDEMLYSKDLSTLIYCPCSKSGEITISPSVTTIGGGAFMDCDTVTSVELPSTLTSIGSSAFFSCTSLTSINIPKTVTVIGDRAFMVCNSLTSIDIPASVTEIGEWAFWRCKSLTKVISLNPEPPTLGEYVFYTCPFEAVYVPASAVSAYQSAEGWSEFSIVGMSNVGDEAVPVYVVSDIVEEEGAVQETREEVSFDFVEYTEVATGQGTATLTREGSSEVVNLPAAQIAGEAAQARALRVVAADGKDYQVVQPLGNAATADGIYTIHFPEGYFLLGTQKENSPAFTMSFTVGDMSGITDAIIDSADAEYYTLQGVKVQGKPTPGIYICRLGNKATKVVVK